jgi:hypothetical protein
MNTSWCKLDQNLKNSPPQGIPKVPGQNRTKAMDSGLTSPPDSLFVSLSTMSSIIP